MKSNPFLPFGLLAFCLGSAPAAQLTLGTTTPSAGDGVQNLSYSTSSVDNTTHDFVPQDYIASDVNGGEALAIGQTFTTGTSEWGFQLNSISVRQVGWGPTHWDFDGGQVSCRLMKITTDLGWGFETQEVASQVVTLTNAESTTIGGTPTSPTWMTFTFDSPLHLDPDAQYAFVFKSNAPADGSSNNFLMEIDGTDADSFAGGTSISVPDGTGTLWKGGGNSDRAFVANMSIPTVPPVPDFTVQPGNASATVNGGVTFTTLAPADPAPTYQWEYSADGTTGWTAIPGENSANLQWFSVQITDEGYYRNVATNANGSDTSNAAFLEVSYAAPTFYLQPSDTAAAEGTEIVLSVTTLTYGNAAYQWYKDGTALEGETSDTLTIPSLQDADKGDYFVRVTDDIEPGLYADSNVATVSLIGIQIASAATAPAVSGSDQSFLPAPELIADTDNIGGGDDAFTYIAHDRPAKGMSFTTGSDPLGYKLNALTIRQVLSPTWADVQPGDVFAFSFGTLSGTTKTPIYQTAAAYAGTPINKANQPGDGVYLTFGLADVSEIGTLNPNTQYYFEVANLSGIAFIEWNGASAGGYAGGEAFGGDTVGGITSTYVAMTGDRVFHADLVGLSDPEDDFASWIAGYPGVGSENGFEDDADRDGLSNGEENYFGTDPTQSSPGISNTRRSGNTVVFEHPENASAASDLSADYEWSTDLGTWNADGASVGGTSVSFAKASATPTAGRATVTATIDGTIPDKIFVRVAVGQD